MMLNPLQAPLQEAQVTMDELVHLNHDPPPNTHTKSLKISASNNNNNNNCFMTYFKLHYSS